MYIFRAVESVTDVGTTILTYTFVGEGLCCLLLLAACGAAMKVITIVIDGFLRLEIGSRHFSFKLKKN
jgi:hypothetical protein